MHSRNDAHIHLFENGYGRSFPSRPGVTIAEADCFETLRKSFGVDQALVVGYAGEPFTGDNNAYLARVVQERNWVHPMAYIDLTMPLAIENLQQYKDDQFIGISLYVFSDQDVSAISKTSDEVWQWLTMQKWLISINSTGNNWTAWQHILERHNKLRILVSHLGLPPKMSKPPNPQTAQKNMASVLGLARFDNTYVKLSGFYAVTDPGYDYPHESAWPYVITLLNEFGSSRLLWASDFSPHLDWLSFPQTFALFEQMPFLTDNDRHRIEGKNLANLLEQVSQ